MDIQNGRQVLRVSADHRCDFCTLVDHMTVTKFHKAEIREFSSSPFSLQLMLNQTLNNVILYLMISQTLQTTVTQTS